MFNIHRSLFSQFFYVRSRLLVSFADFRRSLDLAVDYSNMLACCWLLSLGLRTPPHFLQRAELPCSLVDPPAGSPAGSQRHTLTPPSVEGYLVSSVSTFFFISPIPYSILLIMAPPSWMSAAFRWVRARRLFTLSLSTPLRVRAVSKANNAR